MRSFFQIGECRDFLFFISQKPFSSLTTLQVQIIYRGRYYGVLILILPLHPPIYFVLVMSLEISGNSEIVVFEERFLGWCAIRSLHILCVRAEEL